MNSWIGRVYEYLATYGLRIFAAVLILAVGWWTARFISRLLSKTLIKGKVDKTLANFCRNLCYVIILVFVAIAALNKLGVETTSFAVIVGAIALAIGFGLQGSLANFAAGIMLIIFKPFKTGDFVELAGKSGTVMEIQLFNTVLNSPDNVRVIIPNGQVTNNNILNYTVNGIRRIDLSIGVSYQDDLKKAKDVIEHVLTGHEKVLDDPAPTVMVCELAESSVNFAVRPWAKTDDYWQVYFEVTEQIKIDLDRNEISIPYPQRDVHMVKEHAHAAH